MARIEWLPTSEKRTTKDSLRLSLRDIRKSKIILGQRTYLTLNTRLEMSTKFEFGHPPQKKPSAYRHVELIAEIGSNHGGDFDRARQLAETACSCGADLVKFQLFTADTLWRKGHPRHAETLKVETKPEWIKPLKEIIEKHGKEFLCTPFSPYAVEVLEEAKVKRYKIASGDVTYRPLLQAVALTGKPVLLSIGFSTFAEIHKAIEWLRPSGSREDITLLWCVGDYPTTPARANYPAVLDLIQEFVMQYNCQIGLSSHLKEWWLDLVPMAYKISVIEKHFDLFDS